MFSVVDLCQRGHSVSHSQKGEEHEQDVESV
jgi:hypothetical protein